MNKDLIRKKYLANVNQHLKEPNDYTQGRKDGNREIMALIDDMPTDYSLMNASSPGYRMNDDELIIHIMDELVTHAAALLWEVTEGLRPHTFTKLGLQSAIDLYDRTARAGLLPVIEGHCLSET